MDKEDIKGAALVWLIVFTACVVATFGSLWVFNRYFLPAPVSSPVTNLTDVVVSVAEAAVPSPMTVPDAYIEQYETTSGTWRTVTAYTSSVEETDDTPCISADGTNVCERWQEGETLCAANWVPFGTVLILDNAEASDGEDAVVCTVADRMGSNHPNGVDLYMGYDRDGALEFGRRTMFVKIFEAN